MSYVGSWGSDVVFESLEEDPTDFSLFLSFSYIHAVYFSHIYTVHAVWRKTQLIFSFFCHSHIYMQYISPVEFACAQA